MPADPWCLSSAGGRTTPKYSWYAVGSRSEISPRGTDRDTGPNLNFPSTSCPVKELNHFFHRRLEGLPHESFQESSTIPSGEEARLSLTADSRWGGELCRAGGCQGRFPSTSPSSSTKASNQLPYLTVKLIFCIHAWVGEAGPPRQWCQTAGLPARSRLRRALSLCRMQALFRGK